MLLLQIGHGNGAKTFTNSSESLRLGNVALDDWIYAIHTSLIKINFPGIAFLRQWASRMTTRYQFILAQPIYQLCLDLTTVYKNKSYTVGQCKQHRLFECLVFFSVHSTSKESREINLEEVTTCFIHCV